MAATCSQRPFIFRCSWLETLATRMCHQLRNGTQGTAPMDSATNPCKARRIPSPIHVRNSLNPASTSYRAPTHTQSFCFKLENPVISFVRDPPHFCRCKCVICGVEGHGARVPGRQHKVATNGLGFEAVRQPNKPRRGLAPVSRQVLVPRNLKSRSLSGGSPHVALVRVQHGELDPSKWTRGDCELGALAHGVIVAPAAVGDDTSAQLVSSTAHHARHAAHAMYPIPSLHNFTSAIHTTLCGQRCIRAP